MQINKTINIFFIKYNYGVNNVKLIFCFGDLNILIPEIDELLLAVIAKTPSSVFFCQLQVGWETQASIALT